VRVVRAVHGSRTAATAAAVLIATAAALRAHDPGLSSLDVRVGPDRIVAVLTLAASDVEAGGAAGGDSIEAFARDSVALLAGGVRLPAKIESRVADGQDGVRVTLAFDRRDGPRLTVLSSAAARLAAGHRQLVTVRTQAGQILAERLLDARGEAIEVDLATVPQRAASAGPLVGLCALLVIVAWYRVVERARVQPSRSSD
jgi:hypothetical protein